jgi:hypothetical protein
MARANSTHPRLIAYLPFVKELGEVWCVDGNACVFLGSGRVLVCNWHSLMRFCRRHPR